MHKVNPRTGHPISRNQVTTAATTDHIDVRIRGCSAASVDFPMLVVFRFVVGIGIGGLCVSFDILAEFVPPAQRGHYLMGIELFWFVGFQG